MDSSGDICYHIIIATSDGTVHNTSSYRSGHAPEYVQKYMNQRHYSVSQQTSDSENEDEMKRKLDRQMSGELLLSKMSDASRETRHVEWNQTTGSLKRTADVENCVDESVCHVRIHKQDGTICQTSIQRFSKTPDFIQDCLNKQNKSTSNRTAGTADVENCVDEIVCHVCIRTQDGTICQTSVQSFNKAPDFFHDYLYKQNKSTSNRTADAKHGEEHMVFKKRAKKEFIMHRNRKTVYTEGKNAYVQMFGNGTPTVDSAKGNSTTNTSSSKRLVIIWIICVIAFPETAKARECLESLSTLRITSSCPTTAEQWTEKAQLKGCSKHSQSCSLPNEFVYHCLINAFGNATVEVCAPRKRKSYCVEFNSLGARIQANFRTKCTNISTDCGKFYNSNEMYKVPQCFSLWREPLLTYNVSETRIPVPQHFIINVSKTTVSNTTVNHTKYSSVVRLMPYNADKISKGAGKQGVKKTIGLFIAVLVIIVLLLVLIMTRMKNGQKFRKSIHQIEVGVAKTQLEFKLLDKDAYCQHEENSDLRLNQPGFYVC